MSPTSRRWRRFRSWLDLPARPGRTGVIAGAAFAITGGMLWVLATTPFGLWPLAWIAAVPTLLAIDRAPTPRRAGLWGGLTAVTFTLGGFPWMIHLLVTNAHLPVPVAAIGLGVLAAIHGVVYLIGARLIRGLRDRRRSHRWGPWPLALCGPLGFVVVEVVLWTPFPFSLAITQADVGPVRALSAAMGPAGITAVLIATSGAILDALGGRQRRKWSPAIGLVALVATLAVLSTRSQPSGEPVPIKVGVVQPNQRVDVPLTPPARVALLSALQQATGELEARGADLVVWSEAAYPFTIDRERDRDHDVDTALRIRRHFSVPVVIGAITTDSKGRQWNSAIAIARDGTFVGRHDKVHRMIGSEYNPLIEAFPSTASFMPEGAGSYQGGDRAVRLDLEVADRPLRIAAMVCLEDAMPGFGRDIAALDPDLIVNVTNDTWFGGAEPLQHEAVARFRTIEVGVPMVRAVNTGPSSVIDADGDTLGRLAVREDGGAVETLLVEVPLRPRAVSIYSRWGGPMTWAVSGGALVWWLLPPLIAWVQRRRAGGGRDGREDDAPPPPPSGDHGHAAHGHAAHGPGGRGKGHKRHGKKRRK